MISHVGLVVSCSPPNVFMSQPEKGALQAGQMHPEIPPRLHEVLYRAGHWRWHPTTFLISHQWWRLAWDGQGAPRSVLSMVRHGAWSTVENVSKSSLCVALGRDAMGWYWGLDTVLCGAWLPHVSVEIFTKSLLESETDLGWTGRPSDSTVLTTVLGVARWSDVPPETHRDVCIWSGQPEMPVEGQMAQPQSRMGHCHHTPL